MERLPITAIIPCYNEEANIARAIESVLWADEILVIDSFSTDRTVEIIESYPKVTLLQHEYVNSASQKNWAIPQAKHDWVFLLDADEQATEGLISEVKELIKKPVREVAFWIKRSSYFMGKRVRFSGWQRDKVIRLFLRDNCRYEDNNVHAEIIADGAVGMAKNRILHFTYKGIDKSVERIRWYSTWKAYDKVEKGSSGNFWLLVILKPFWRFFNQFILQLGFLDGKVGFHIAALSAYDVYIRGLKIIRILEGEVIEKDKK
ncbi:glycosyltransferase family 2 protein [Roseivirga pacifica]|uniref:glycosyltransferase family 2 protein n=1 Tax=Roseivirga pacifica TaxID=1267423 RepID=UPI00227D1D81|nr:glycosyltransferase family 2 protein [Roseivirga pacifica]